MKKANRELNFYAQDFYDYKLCGATRVTPLTDVGALRFGPFAVSCLFGRDHPLVWRPAPITSLNKVSRATCESSWKRAQRQNAQNVTVRTIVTSGYSKHPRVNGVWCRSRRF